MPHTHRILAAALGGALWVTLAPGAFAQVTAEQQAAIKSSCRSDFMSNCSGVQPGGAQALQCLQKNVAKLSPSCQSAVSATIPKPAPAAAAAAAPAAAPPPAPAAAATPAPAPAAPAAAAAPAPAIAAAKPPAASIAPPKASAAAPAAPQVTAAQQSAIKSACRSDFMSNCSGVQPGGAAALQCLQKNAARLSPSCQAAVGATMPKQAAVPAAAAAPAAVAVEAPPAPTAQQMAAVKNTCRADFARNCKGVPPGGPEALACLQRNGAKLSPNCKTSLADIADSIPAGAAPAAAAATTTTTTTTTTTEHRRLPPGITPAGRILRRVMERNQQ
ncbi:MAG: hypothetical protein JSR72_05605 [Proteobacteria bacterium]|nr:hypothetical protein [Pseudomonadota bacterium]